jgi:hypothetical protein
MFAPCLRNSNMHVLDKSVSKNNSLRVNVTLFFLCILGLYLALTPGAIGGMGYNSEEIQAGVWMADSLRGILTGSGRPEAAIPLCRNGYVTVALDVPAHILVSFFPEKRAYLKEWVIAVQTCVLAALLSSLLFVWLSRKLASQRLPFFLSLLAAFATMYWPYAYIGLENKSSLFLLVAGWLALEGPANRAWKTTVLFCLASGLALSVKSNGLMLAPVIVFLAWHLVSRLKAKMLPIRQFILCCVLVIAFPVVFAVAGWASRAPFWSQHGGAAGFAVAWGPRDALAPLFHFVGLFGSPNKGLVVYVPVTLLALWVLPLLWRRHREYVIFATLTLLGVAGGSSLLRFWSEETWGPRYLHVAIGPLILCLGLFLSQGLNSAWRAALAAVFAAGFFVASLGAFFNPGSLHQTAIRSGQSTLEALQGDIVWNHILFNARLMKWWLRPGESAEWTPEHQWFYEPPPGAQSWPVLDLSPMARPQSVLLREWGEPMEGLGLGLWRTYVASGISGFCLLVVLFLRMRAMKDSVAESAGPQAAEISPDSAK